MGGGSWFLGCCLYLYFLSCSCPSSCSYYFDGLSTSRHPVYRNRGLLASEFLWVFREGCWLTYSVEITAFGVFMVGGGGGDFGIHWNFYAFYFHGYV